MLTFTNPSLPQDALVLVTGVNGLIGSHIADKLLEYGYRVRGTVRDIARNAWMVSFFEEKYSVGSFGLVEVKEMAAEGAFEEAMKGVSGVIHVASDVSFSPDVKQVIQSAIAGTLTILSSAAKAGVQRFVLTSSSDAAVNPKPNNYVTITKDSWNEERVKLAYDDTYATGPGEEELKGLVVYSASKVLGEQALWKWVSENEDKGMVVNSVLPGGNFGKILSPENQGFRTTTMLAAALFNNDEKMVASFIHGYVPEWFVDVQDNALLHVAALLHQDVKSERIFAWAEPYNWNLVLAIFRKNWPERNYVEDVEGLWLDEAVVEGRERTEELLRELKSGEGFTGLEESLKKTFGGIA